MTDAEVLSQGRNRMAIDQHPRGPSPGVKPSAAVGRYSRALKWLKDVLRGRPGGVEGTWG
jgi:hypothetical protein